ncbi:DNA mismatch repair endonuclease MutL [Patescibacteria group bacterium]|nr:DNA mismatch repair endonuclease MutL [Patescibacteria group bacterium]
MSKIKFLDGDVVSKIAAGEVIERPVSVVKELVENALDAKASWIVVRIKKGGLEEITVIDDGVGMAKEDLLLCMEKHATSKLSAFSDLQSLITYGFRGEALYSISTISHVTISSKEDSALEGFSLVDGVVTPLGMASGTKVTVEDLFYNMPVRRKILSDANLEFKKISALVHAISLVNHKVRFTIYRDGKECLDLPIANNLHERVSDIFGTYVLDNMVEVERTDAHFSMHGYISKPAPIAQSGIKQYFFVNNRLVAKDSISILVDAVYRMGLETSVSASYILFLTVPAEFIDINIHPQKEKVGFLNQDSVHEFIKTSLQRTLEENDLTNIKSGFTGITNYMSTYLDTLQELPSDYDLAKVLQVHNSYLIKGTPTGITIVDQHAAHERILYEHLVSLYKNGATGNSVELVKPFNINFRQAFGAENAFLLNDYKKTLTDIGFIFIEKAAVTVITHAPEILHGRNLKQLLTEYMQELGEHSSVRGLDKRSLVALSHLACKAAIKVGEEITQEQASYLLNQLEKTKIKYMCPHGRPLIAEISLREIEKLFKR